MDIGFIYKKFSEAGSISTDTRKIIPGSIFFALRGERFNGNEFAARALEQGAAWVVMDDPTFLPAKNYTLVPDVLACLQELARHHRSTLKIPVIGLTGSNGKTTSKELVNAVLSRKFRTLATQGNLNNHIGVPLTILSITRETELAIIEMGANHLQEIALLCSIARPTHGFITNIGKAHIGTFGGFENIIRGKSELYQHLLSDQGVVFINSLNSILSRMAHRFKEPVMYPGPSDFIHVELLESQPYLVCRADGRSPFRTNLTGAYNFENIAVALCVGKYFGVPLGEAEAAVSGYLPSNMRSQFVERGSNRIILDAYNANPTSMEAAIQNLASMTSPNKIAVLGDMYELGDETEKEHRAVGEQLNRSGLQKIFLCGPLMKEAKAACPDALHFNDRDTLAAYLEENPLSNAVVLIKASRGMGLEKLLEKL
ncbi:MAG: UDP-N-acetylmuramoyl-tripeptide--D-alanyl-D-alanine ligase [Bacteroidetes bacterium]|nr:UDP-N-acetylmuramoyl-tripeptide--D-alanyl-D-alanine ligase [Bacteroidota bacterium]